MRYRIIIDTLEVNCDFLSETAELLQPHNWERLTITRFDEDGVEEMYGPIVEVIGEPPCCDYQDHSPGPCACPGHEQSALHPFSHR